MSWGKYLDDNAEYATYETVVEGSRATVYYARRGEVGGVTGGERMPLDLFQPASRTCVAGPSASMRKECLTGHLKPQIQTSAANRHSEYLKKAENRVYMPQNQHLNTLVEDS